MKKIYQILLLVFLTGCFGNEAPSNTVPGTAPISQPTPTEPPAPISTDDKGEEATNQEDIPEDVSLDDEFTGLEADDLSEPATHPSGKKEINILFLSHSRIHRAEVMNSIYNHLVGKKYDDPRDIIVPFKRLSKNYNITVDKFKNYDENSVNSFQIEIDHSIVTLWDTEYDAKEIPTALNDKKINAVCIVVTEDNFHRIHNSSFAHSIEVIRRMLPKSYENNLIGVFTDLRGMSKSARLAHVTNFNELFELQEPVSTLFLDARNILSEEFEEPLHRQLDMRQWEEDKATAFELIEKANALNPVSGRGLQSIEKMIKKMSDLTEKLTVLQDKEIYLRLLELEAEHPNELSKMQEFVKAGELEFGKSLSKELRTKKLAELQAKQTRLIRAHRKINLSLEQYSMTPKASPYEKFLRKRAYEARNMVGSKLEKDFQEKFYENKLKQYQLIQ